MRIGWDSDGVLYKFTKAYHLGMNTHYGMSLDTEVEAHTWNWFLDFGQSVADFKRCMDELVDAKQLFWEGELYEPQIGQNIADLRAAGHTNHLITYRFSGISQCSRAATEYFYGKMGIEFDSITYSKDKTVVPTDVFLEDSVDNYDALEATGTISFLVNRPYNQLNDARRRVNSVDEYTNLILETSCYSYASF